MKASSATPTSSDALADSRTGRPAADEAMGGTFNVTVGAVVSAGARTITCADATSALPAASMAITRMICTPGAVGVQWQV
ncbi:hypothetical protein D9M69_593310 [compost metagenome]